MRLLVTGGAGYIGSVVAALLVESGHEVTVFDDLSLGHRDAVPDRAELRHVNLLDPSALAAALRTTGRTTGRGAGRGAGRYDAVMHLAALSLVGESATEPVRYVRHNVAMTANLIEAMRDYDIPTVVFSSTAAVYGESRHPMISETDTTAPTNAYGASKLAADHMLGFAASAYGIAAVSLRYFNVAGSYGRFGERHLVETHLIPRLLAVAAGEAAAVEVYGTDYATPDGTAVRDYIHVRDLADAHLAAVDAARPGEHLVLNLGTGLGYSVLEVVAAVTAVTGRGVAVIPRPRRVGDPAQLVAAGDRAREVLGWLPKHPDLGTMIADAWAFRGG